MVARCFRIAMLAAVILVAAPNICAEAADPALHQEIVSPTLEVRGPKERHYRPGDVVVYQVLVHWPSLPENARLNSPEIATENLKFLGVSQETTAEENPPGRMGETVQILNFKFAGQKPGPAKVDRFPLRWTLAEGAATTSVTVPELQLNITDSSTAWLKPPFLLISAALLLLPIVILFAVTQTKKQKVPAVFAENLSEDTALRELEAVQTGKENKGNVRDFLSRLSQIFYRYLDQKLGWNPTKGSYNDIRKSVEEKWSKKEASELKELIDQLEYLRFSEGKKDPDAAEKLCNAVSSFIERRKIG